MKPITCTGILLLFFMTITAQSYIPNSICTFKYKSSSKSEEDKQSRRMNRTEDWLKMDSISLYGGGLLYGLITGDENTEETTSPSGSIGLNFASDRLSCNFYFSYNGKKTLEINTIDQFGISLMNPYRGGQSVSFSALGQLGNYGGFSTHFLTVDNLWQLDSTTTIDASPLVAKLGFYITPFDFVNDSDNNKINFAIMGHYVYRGILGDFNNNDQIIGNQTIVRRGYHGFELSANVVLNSVEMFVQYSTNRKGDIEIPRFTGGQIVIGVNVVGDLIKIR